MPTPAPVEMPLPPPLPCSDVEVLVLTAPVVVAELSCAVAVFEAVAETVFVAVDVDDVVGDDVVGDDVEVETGGSSLLMLKYADETCPKSKLPWLSAVPLNNQKKKTLDCSRSKSYSWTRQLKESLTSGGLVPRRRSSICQCFAPPGMSETLQNTHYRRQDPKLLRLHSRLVARARWCTCPSPRRR